MASPAPGTLHESPALTASRELEVTPTGALSVFDHGRCPYDMRSPPPTRNAAGGPVNARWILHLDAPAAKVCPICEEKPRLTFEVFRWMVSCPNYDGAPDSGHKLLGMGTIERDPRPRFVADGAPALQPMPPCENTKLTQPFVGADIECIPVLGQPRITMGMVEGVVEIFELEAGDGESEV